MTTIPICQCRQKGQPSSRLHENGTETAVDNMVLATLLLHSFRYCLGRMTYAVGECVEHLTMYWNLLPAVWQNQIQRDIRQAIERGTAGMECDVMDWEKVLKLEVREKA